MANDFMVDVLKEQVKPALGCTEPVAVGIAVSNAYKQIGGDIEEIYVKTSPNIFKNGLRVGIPGTKETGLHFAIALSAICGDPDLKLEVFKNVNDQYVEEAKKIVNDKKTKIDIENEKANFYIEANVKTSKGNAVCIIKDNHTNITYVEANGDVLFQKEEGKEEAAATTTSVVDRLKEVSIKDMKEFVENVPFKDIEFLLDGVKMNMDIAEYGLNNNCGANLGQGINKLINNKIIENDIVNKVRAITSAACDARMSGVNMSVMSSAGSGNHGITAIIPVTVVCREHGYDDEKIARAVAFSHLITSYIKLYTGRLSPVCGCAVAAGIGAASAMTWVLGGNEVQIAGAIKNMVSNISGLACDGAKGGCAFKLSTAAAEATLHAHLAVNNTIVSNLDGIVGNKGEDTIQYLGKFASDGMKSMDNTIIDIMFDQQTAK
ncbi:serine dehydratase subunit alpha family protein [Abyssisolibacter fermentans]|uniref:L-cysteine desulfidase family protein n=1 Tax=Abyssisolibacter fermentans TaxID=1766203 RepID=UPI0008378036|nr:L-serine ammonia-lyase, iron-sulfur-dependent, subunit alpha [Abyssisolibacter fermentans]